MPATSNEVAKAVALAFTSRAEPPAEIVMSDFRGVMEAEAVNKYMSGKTWDAVDFLSDMWLLDETVWFSRDGFLYYLPGMMIAAIETDDPDHLCLLVSRMARLAGRANMSMSDYFQPLSDMQRQAVGTFVRYVVGQDVCLKEELEDSSRYWLAK